MWCADHKPEKAKDAMTQHAAGHEVPSDAEIANKRGAKSNSKMHLSS